MRNIYSVILGILLISGGCVDDYTESNPPHLLDAPTFRVNRPSNEIGRITTVPVNQFQNGYTSIATYGNPVDYTVSIIDAPGKIGAISASASIPDFGSVIVDEASVAALQGKETGDFKFTFLSNSSVSDFIERNLNIVITVSDSQFDEKGEASPLTTSMTIPVTLVKCLSEGLQAGDYRVTAASGNLDGGALYTLDDLLVDGDVSEISVTITKVRPGRYKIDELTGGVWPVYYSARANPALDVHLCGNSITGHDGALTTGAGSTAQRKFTVAGTLNNNGTISITWSYVRETGSPIPAIHAKGTYTLSPI